MPSVSETKQERKEHRAAVRQRVMSGESVSRDLLVQCLAGATPKHHDQIHGMLEERVDPATAMLVLENFAQPVTVIKRLQESQSEERRRRVEAALSSKLEGWSTGTLTWGGLKALAPTSAHDLLDALDAHPHCGIVPERPNRETVVSLHSSGYPKERLTKLLEGRTHLELGDFVRACSVEDPVAMELTKSGRTHACLDELVAERRDAPVRFLARVHRAAERAAKKERLAAERAAERARQSKEAEERRRAETVASNETRIRLGLDVIAEQRSWLFTAEVAEVLGIGESAVRDAAEKKLLQSTRVPRAYKAPYRRYPLAEVARIAGNAPEWLVQARLRRRQRATTAAERNARVADAVGAALPVRRRPPVRVVAHLGPTNSGKTHDALTALAEAGRGTYAAPLRMLAYEAYERLTARLGEGAVGLVTGEERVTEAASIVCCTAEMAPMRGEILVLDEVQWADDEERGWAWTRLLAGAEYEEIRLCGAPDALPLVRAAFPDAEVVFHERLCPLSVCSQPLTLESAPRGSVLVCFSRKAVLHVAGMLQHAGRSVAVLYGAMPPAVRRAEVARFVSGEADVVVATDVIGHGINLPVSHVLFCETNKFDGERRRPLHLHEVAQIGGRAGRYGMEPKVVVGWVKGVPGLVPDPKVVTRLSDGPRVPIEGVVVGYRKVEKAMLGPSLEQLGCESASDLPEHLVAWKRVAWSLVKDAPWVSISPVAPLLGRLGVLKAEKVLKKLPLEDAWRLTRSPLDADDEGDARLLGDCARAVAEGLSLEPLVSGVPGGSLEAVERVARRAAGLRWFTLAFPGAGGITHAQACAFEERCTEKARQLLASAIVGGVKRCGSCGKPTAPWFRECDSCHSARWDWRGSWYEDEDEDEDDEEWPEPPKRKKLAATPSSAKATYQSLISEAAAADPTLERPRHFSRKMWWSVVQRLQEMDAATRAQMIPALIAVCNEKGNGELEKGGVDWCLGQAEARVLAESSGPRLVLMRGGAA